MAEAAGIEHVELPVDDSGEVKVHLFGNDVAQFLKSPMALTLNSTFKRFTGCASSDYAGPSATGQSSQAERTSGSGGMGFSTSGKMQVEQPLVDPVSYREVYRRDPQVRACVDAIVQYVAGQGWRLRPRNELFGNDQFSVATKPSAEPDMSQLETALDFLNGSDPEYSLMELIQRTELDAQSEGAGYIEVIRGADSKPVRLCYAPGETMRILTDYSGFVQVRGKAKAFWSRYGTGNVSAVVKKSGSGKADAGDPLGDLEVEFVGKTVKDLEYEPCEMDEVEEWVEKAGPSDAMATSVNQMMHFPIYTPRDTNYGEPPIISAIEDYLGVANSRLFMISYFDRCTVPRLAVVVKGDLTEKVVETLKKWAESQDKLEAMNSTLVLELPEGTEAEFEKLSLEQLKDGGLLEYRAACNEAIRMAYRTPESVTGVVGNSNRSESGEANAQFINGVVRPRQLSYMAKINWLLKNELGVTDWVFDLNVPDLDSEKTKAEIADVYLRRGVATINEIRKSQGRASVEGGDVPFVLVPGAGTVPIPKLEDIYDRMATAKLQKTPAKDASPVMAQTN